MENWRERMPCQDVLDCYEQAGLGWTSEHVPDGVMYSGDEGVVHLGGCDDWSGAHELAHWLLAPPERRAVDDYGGGRGEHSTVDRDVLLSGIEAGEDEQLAQALTVAILQAVGCLGWQFRRYSTCHMGTLTLDWAELRRRGLLTPGNVPAFLGDQERVLEMPGPQQVVWLPEGSGVRWWV
jgi:hypothetical protein